MEHKLAWYSLAPHLKSLRLLGSYHLDPKTTSQPLYMLHQVFMRFVFCMPVVYSIQHCIFIYKERYDVKKVVDAMFLLLTFAASMYKQLVLWLKADLLEDLLDIMKDPLMNPEDDQHKQLLLSTANRAKATLYVFYCLSQATCFTWALFPMIARLNGGTTEFAMWLPVDEERFLYGVLFYIWIQCSLLGITSSTVDVFLAYLLVQCKTQLSILRSDLETLVERSEQLSKKESVTFKQAFQKLFTSCVHHHLDITRLALSIDKVFGGAVFFQFLVTGWILCTTAYRCINTDPASLEFLSMILYLGCILTEVFLFCYYGNELTYESERLTESAYKMNWLIPTVDQRRSVIIFMERIKRPIQPLAGNIIPLSLSTFTSIMRSSYTFYTVLKTTEV